MQETFNLEKSYVESLQFLVIVSLKCEDHSEILYYRQHSTLLSILEIYEPPEESRKLTYHRQCSGGRYIFPGLEIWMLKFYFLTFQTLQIPNILHLHEGFLEDLKRRLENWDSKKTIGDWFLNSVSAFPSSNYAANFLECTFLN